MEARAKSRLRDVAGLWRKPVLGRGGATPHPGSITEFSRERGLRPPAEVDHIIETAPTALLNLQAAQAALPPKQLAPMGHWLDDFHRAADAAAIAESQAAPQGRKIIMATAAKYAPNRQRWGSFGWRVID